MNRKPTIQELTENTSKIKPEMKYIGEIVVDHKDLIDYSLGVKFPEVQVGECSEDLEDGTCEDTKKGRDGCVTESYKI